MGLESPPLKINIRIGPNPLKSRILVRRLAAPGGSGGGPALILHGQRLDRGAREDAHLGRLQANSPAAFSDGCSPLRALACDLQSPNPSARGLIPCDHINTIAMDNTIAVIQQYICLPKTLAAARSPRSRRRPRRYNISYYIILYNIMLCYI